MTRPSSTVGSGGGGPRRRRPVGVDLFSGVGGMALGFEQAGFDVVTALEIDPAHAAAHRFNFPNCELIEADASQVNPDQVKRAVTRGLVRHGRPNRQTTIDVVFGGPPCQGFSVGGLLDPADPRNRLVEQFARLVTVLQPRAFVLENVPAMATRKLPGEADPVPKWLERHMAEAGYTRVYQRVLNASRFGVPQDRRRLVLVGLRDGENDFAFPSATHAAAPTRPGRRLFPGEIGHAATDTTLPAGATVADALADLPDLDLFEELLTTDSVAVERPRPSRRSAYAAVLAGDEYDATDLSQPRIWDRGLLTASLRTMHAPEVVARFAATPVGEREPISRFGRLYPLGASQTLRAGSASDRGSFSAPRPIHPTYPRVISVREAARLHGYPDWFRFSAAKWHGFRQVGNSVCPPLAKAIAESVRDSLGLPAIAEESPIALGDEALLRVPSSKGKGRRSSRSNNHNEQQASCGELPEPNTLLSVD